LAAFATFAVLFSAPFPAFHAVRLMGAAPAAAVAGSALALDRAIPSARDALRGAQEPDTIVAAFVSGPAPESEALAEPEISAEAEPAQPPSAAAPQSVSIPRTSVQVPLPGGVLVIASWYGPGFYGNYTACGQIYTPAIIGVAHKTLPCGTLITITSPAGMTVTVPVIDRGPYIAGRELDLSNATRAALACSDLCTVRMLVR
jgi:hypothetical protein